MKKASRFWSTIGFPVSSFAGLLAVATLLMGSAANLTAATFTAADITDNEWGTAGNWDTNVVPDDSSEDAIINLSGADAADLSTGSFIIRALRIGQGGGQVGELNATGGDLNADGTVQDRIGVGGGTGTVNQSAGTIRLAGNQVQLGLDLNSTGTYNLNGGSFVGARETGGTTLFLGTSGGKGHFNISGAGTSFTTRAGVAVGQSGHANDAITEGVFHVAGSGISQIGVGSEGSLDGRWLQFPNGTLRTGIDAGGITPILIDNVSGGGGHVTFEEGATLDPYDLGGAPLGVWHTVMNWGGNLTDNGLTLSTTAAASGWSFQFDGNSLQVMLIPEPTSLLLVTIGGMLVLARSRSSDVGLK